MTVEPEQTTQASAADDPRLQAIKEVIEEVRPNLRRDGGDCELVSVEGNRIMVKLSGACVFCSLASATIEGIQSKMVERLGELVRLIPVPNGGKPGMPMALKPIMPVPLKKPDVVKSQP